MHFITAVKLYKPDVTRKWPVTVRIFILWTLIFLQLCKGMFIMIFSAEPLFGFPLFSASPAENKSFIYVNPPEVNIRWKDILSWDIILWCKTEAENTVPTQRKVLIFICEIVSCTRVMWLKWILLSFRNELFQSKATLFITSHRRNLKGRFRN